MTATRADTHRDHCGYSFFDGLNRQLIGVTSHHTMTMTGVDEDMLGNEAQFLEFCPDVWQIRISNVPDTADCNCIDRHNNGCCLAIGNRQRFHIRRIIYWPGSMIRDFDTRHTSSERCGCFRWLLSLFVQGIRGLWCHAHQKHGDTRRELRY